MVKFVLEPVSGSVSVPLPPTLAALLPRRLLELLTSSNGGYAASDESYIALLPLEEMLRVNEANSEALASARLAVFATNGADEAYTVSVGGSDMGAVYMVPLSSLTREDAVLVAATFDDFLAGTGIPAGW